MANNPQPPTDGHHDPAGSTQMFRAFVDDAAPPPGTGRRATPEPAPTGPRLGLILGVIVGIAVAAGAVWLAFG